jgi:hypothetical protein
MVPWVSESRTADVVLQGGPSVSAQHVEDDGDGGMRIAQAVAPERVISVVDPEACHGHRSRRDRYDGYKPPLSVDVTSDLFIAGEATTAGTSDAEVLPALLARDPMAVSEVTADTHYGDATTRKELPGRGSSSSPRLRQRRLPRFISARTPSRSTSKPGQSPARPARWPLSRPRWLTGFRPAFRPQPAGTVLWPHAAPSAPAGGRSM